MLDPIFGDTGQMSVTSLSKAFALKVQPWKLTWNFEVLKMSYVQSFSRFSQKSPRKTYPHFLSPGFLSLQKPHVCRRQVTKGFVGPKVEDDWVTSSVAQPGQVMSCRVDSVCVGGDNPPKSVL